MKYVSALLLFTSLSVKAQQPVMHCGYDFTSFLVMDVHEAGKKENIKGLKVTIVDFFGRDVINVNNIYSYTNANKPLIFTSNYLVGDDNQRLPEGAKPEKERWFFPFAKDNYLLSVSTKFPAGNFRVKVEDTDGEANGGKFKTVTVPIFDYNMYVLCSSESRDAAVKFGRKMNKPVAIVLEKE